jgi:excinuclease ABC subunit A
MSRPSALHQRDNDKLIKTLHDLRDLGNTIIVVEHDEDTIRASDYLVDIGPGAGIHGGKIIAEGPVPEILKDPKQTSPTLEFLRGKRKIEVPEERRRVKTETAKLKIKNASANNLKNITVDIPVAPLHCRYGRFRLRKIESRLRRALQSDCE